MSKKKSSKVSPTQRTNKLLRDRGYILDIAESYNAFTGRRHDLFNFIDVAALHVGKGELLAIQTTTKSNLKARIKKAEGLKSYWAWLRSGNPVEFHGWSKEDRVWLPNIIRVEKPDWVY